MGKAYLSNWILAIYSHGRGLIIGCNGLRAWPAFGHVCRGCRRKRQRAAAVQDASRGSKALRVLVCIGLAMAFTGWFQLQNMKLRNEAKCKIRESPDFTDVKW